MATQLLALPSYAQLSDADQAALTDPYRRGTPPNTLRTRERDLANIAAWKMASFGRPLAWPEDEQVVLRFILDHAQDVTGKPGAAQDVAMELQALDLRTTFACPAPATLDRRIASWQAFHRMRNLTSPFSAPLVQRATKRCLLDVDRYDLGHHLFAERRMVHIPENHLKGMLAWRKIKRNLRLSLAKVDVIVIGGDAVCPFFSRPLALPHRSAVDQDMVVACVFRFCAGGGNSHALQAHLNQHGRGHRRTILKVDEIDGRPIGSGPCRDTFGKYRPRDA